MASKRDAEVVDVLFRPEGLSTNPPPSGQAPMGPPPDTRDSRSRALSRDEDLPVVARMVIEIRSDGTRTVARGAIEDVATGQQAKVVARGGSPLGLAMDLTRSITRGLAGLPIAATSAVVRRLLGRRG